MAKRIEPKAKDIETYTAAQKVDLKRKYEGRTIADKQGLVYTCIKYLPEQGKSEGEIVDLLRLKRGKKLYLIEDYKLEL